MKLSGACCGAALVHQCLLESSWQGMRVNALDISTARCLSCSSWRLLPLFTELFYLLTRVNPGLMAELLKICYKVKLLDVVNVLLGRRPELCENMGGGGLEQRVMLFKLENSFRSHLDEFCLMFPKKRCRKQEQTMQMDSLGLIRLNVCILRIFLTSPCSAISLAVV